MTKWLTYRKKLLLVLGATVASTGLWWWLSLPVLFRISDGGEESSTDYEYRILNPLRDTRPERVADHFLNALKNGGACPEMLSALDVKHGDAEVERICARENDLRIISWDLRDRHDVRGRVKMFYWVQREGYSGPHAPVWLTVEGTGENMRVISFSPIY